MLVRLTSCVPFRGQIEGPGPRSAAGRCRSDTTPLKLKGLLFWASVCGAYGRGAVRAACGGVERTRGLVGHQPQPVSGRFDVVVILDTCDLVRAGPIQRADRETRAPQRRRPLLLRLSMCLIVRGWRGYGSERVWVLACMHTVHAVVGRCVRRAVTSNARRGLVGRRPVTDRK